MRIFLILLTAIALFGAQLTPAQTQPRSNLHYFRLRFPQSVDTADLSISWFITGPFGGYRSFVRTEPNTWEYLIDTRYEEQPARTLKAIIYCPGYGIELLDIAALDNTSIRNADVELTPLPSKPLSGKLNWPREAITKEVQIEVLYLAYWGHEFYGIADGAVARFKVASTKVAEDGSFSLKIPDFSRDPIVNKFKVKGVLSLIARESGTGNIRYRLERSELPGREVELNTDESRGTTLILNAIPDSDR